MYKINDLVLFNDEGDWSWPDMNRPCNFPHKDRSKIPFSYKTIYGRVMRLATDFVWVILFRLSNNSPVSLHCNDFNAPISFHKNSVRIKPNL